ncbi:hypothetical protein B0J11DRAFT_548169 [Dendryphion nanum]|uniref:Glucose-methanol-choline oxidoreductase N-terminal domain-containing protein n=1 Tax=Dendryphion nanum TaxID=256645 RepID=A0A9P9IV45_9PLEO|nr:hypothetical protein B0J11DRAFT_548169 [Dendryphion nanum]
MEFAPPSVYTKRQNLAPHYDFIIAGGGTSGLTVANRLTAEFPDRSVLVVEYGQLVNSSVILQPAATVPDPRYAFQVLSQPEAGLNNRSFTVTVGKIVGGCSAINAQMFDRGSAADYDAWAEVTGAEYKEAGWDWKGLLPYFKKSTTFTPPPKAIAEMYNYTFDIEAAWGGNGPIQAVYPPFQWASEKILRTAWNELGVPTQKESSGGDAYGVILFPSSQDPKSQTRSYARTGHYDPVAHRKNYHLLVGHKVNELIMKKSDGDSADWQVVGVKIQAVDGKNASIVEISSGEVILAAGAIHTPGILQRSGIGPKNVLSVANIQTRVDLPGVGQNFQDHAMSNLFYNLTKDVLPNAMSMFRNRTLMDEARRQYEQERMGPLTLSGGNSGAFLSLSAFTNNSAAIIHSLSAQSPSSYLPDDTHTAMVEGYSHQLNAFKDLLSSKEAAVFEYPIGSGAMIAFLKPLSRGTVNINPKDPLAAPIVKYRTFSNPLDVKLFIEGVKIYRQMFSTPSASALGPVELTPGSAIQTDADWEKWLRRSVSPSFYHPVGTASLGPRSRGGVVDEELKVHAVKNLRVVDASIMPLIPGTHTSSTVYAVAEKAADLIISDVKK